MAKREIRKLSRTTNLLFPKHPFNRLVREIAQDINCNMKFKKNAILTIQASLLICTCSHTHTCSTLITNTTVINRRQPKPL